jgi:hypothetical protein
LPEELSPSLIVGSVVLEIVYWFESGPRPMRGGIARPAPAVITTKQLIFR